MSISSSAFVSCFKAGIWPLLGVDALSIGKCYMEDFGFVAATVFLSEVLTKGASGYKIQLFLAFLCSVHSKNQVMRIWHILGFILSKVTRRFHNNAVKSDASFNSWKICRISWSKVGATVATQNEKECCYPRVKQLGLSEIFLWPCWGEIWRQAGIL